MSAPLVLPYFSRSFASLSSVNMGPPDPAIGSQHLNQWPDIVVGLIRSNCAALKNHVFLNFTLAFFKVMTFTARN
jgi:hypothetical protein